MEFEYTPVAMLLSAEWAASMVGGDFNHSDGIVQVS